MSETQPGYHYFAAYIKEQHQKEVRPPNALGSIGCAAMFLAVPVFTFGISVPEPKVAIVGGGIFSVGIVLTSLASYLYKKAKKRDEVEAAIDDQTVLLEAAWFEAQHTLEERSHPRLIPLLEACSKAWSQVRESLRSERWKERIKDQAWKSLHDSCLQANDSAMRDALWASRKLFRRKGWRKMTFEKNCADPEYGKHAFARLEVIKGELEELANHVSDEVFTHQLEQSAIRNVLEDIRHVHEARDELDRDVPRLT